MLFGRMNLIDLLYNIPAVLICITVHEFSHGYVAYRLGDPTARESGRLSLNPLRHIDPVGFICLILFRFGWAKPVPVSFGYLKNPKRDMAVIAAAGPVSNTLLAFLLIAVSTALLAFFPNFYGLYTFCQFLYITAIISVGLAVFNLIPVHPLDGSRIFLPLLSKKSQAFLFNNSQTIQIIMVLLLVFGLFSGPISFVTNIILRGIVFLVNVVYRLFGINAGFLYGIFGL
ncbi:MAG: site-2 protease family protein [Bacillota bacterium]|nr:site-2 protease family protein [Bacillota bacterium]